MKIYPAIDIKDGQCVRLKQGRMSDAVVYNPDPLAQAQAFVDAGAKRLHVVDLDGAFAGHSVNGAVVARMVKKLDIPIQLGGGIRSIKAIEQWLEIGLAHVIISSAAVESSGFMKNATKKFPGKIMLGLDTENDQVMVKGWAESSGMTTNQLLERLDKFPLGGIIHTDISRDGMKTGVNYQATEALAKRVNLPVIASGGLGSMEDVHALLSCTHIAGVISGRALYDGSLDLTEVLKVME